MGTVVARYGGEECVAVHVRLADGQYSPFWPRDLEEIPSPKAWWRLLLGGDSAGELGLLFTGVRGRSFSEARLPLYGVLGS
jgi:hypothetical protein